MLWRRKCQTTTADVTSVASTSQHLEKSEQCLSPYRNNHFTSASNTKEYRYRAMGTAENFGPKTLKMKTGDASKLPIPIHASTGRRVPGHSGSYNFWAIGT